MHFANTNGPKKNKRTFNDDWDDDYDDMEVKYDDDDYEDWYDYDEEEGPEELYNIY